MSQHSVSERAWQPFVPCPYCKGRKDKRADCDECEHTGNLRVVQELDADRRERDDLERHIAGPLW